MRIIIFTLLFCSAQGKECGDRRGQPEVWRCEVQPCHHAAVPWWGDSCEGPVMALGVVQSGEGFLDALVRSKATHLPSKAGPWEQTSPFIPLAGHSLLSVASKWFKLPVAPVPGPARLAWEATSPHHPSISSWQQRLATLPQTHDLCGMELTTTRN